MGWSKQRLEEVVQTRLGHAKLVVVANREPFIHVYDGDEVRCLRPASGVTTALDPVMQACSGVWVAHGSGDADRAVADQAGRVRVPPEKPAYVLRRVWLSKEEEQGYYYGFANESLWPLCHVAHTRPRFDPQDWAQYRRVNQKFARAVLEEVKGQPAVVFVQDYHFALLPRLLKNARPDLVILQFWHIPWPNREVFRICPWREEILDGLLGNDLLAFHIQCHCNNFLDTVDRCLESKVDMERFEVTRGGKTTIIRPQPISIDPDAVADLAPADVKKTERQLRRRLRVGNLPLVVSVDRVDYIKGIPERFRAVDRMLTLHPDMKGKFAFVQVGAPSRVHIATYRQLNEELDALADEINWRHGDETWRPIRFINEHYHPEQVYALYRAATCCVVSSLHDGMNLVAKEFVAARTDLQGVLILSHFTGAARELADALLINPYAVDDFAEALRQALRMLPQEQEQRLRRLRQQVADNNIYRWAGMLLSEAGKLLDAQQLTSSGSQQPVRNGHGGMSGQVGRAKFGPTERGGGLQGRATSAAAKRHWAQWTARGERDSHREEERLNIVVNPQDAINRLSTGYRSGGRLVMLFDYDGTLTPIVEHPQLAQLLPTAHALLQQLACQPRVWVGVVSGRMIDDIKSLVAIPCLYYAGTGGLELDLAGVPMVPPQAAEGSLLVSDLAHRLRRFTFHYPGTWVEAKRLGLTVHYRGLAAGWVPEFRSGVEQLLRSALGRLRVGPGPMAIEVTLDLGWDKGFAVRRIVEHVGQPVLLLYAGDEANDEEAFREVTAQGGVAIGIGPRAPLTSGLRLPDPAALLQFLSYLLQALEDAPRWSVVRTSCVRQLTSDH